MGATGLLVAFAVLLTLTGGVALAVAVCILEALAVLTALAVLVILAVLTLALAMRRVPRASPGMVIASLCADIRRRTRYILSAGGIASCDEPRE